MRSTTASLHQVGTMRALGVLDTQAYTLVQTYFFRGGGLTATDLDKWV